MDNNIQAIKDIIADSANELDLMRGKSTSYYGGGFYDSSGSTEITSSRFERWRERLIHKLSPYLVESEIDLIKNIEQHEVKLYFTELSDDLNNLPHKVAKDVPDEFSPSVRRQVPINDLTGKILMNKRIENETPPKNDRTIVQNSGTLSIFLCHSSNDKSQVRELYKKLKTDRFDPWLDEEKLLPGQDWKQEIPKAVRKADVVIVCLSRSSITKTGYVQKEIIYALDIADEQPEDTIFLIPLKLEECEVPRRLSKWHWVNYFEKSGYEKLLHALHVRATTR